MCQCPAANVGRKGHGRLTPEHWCGEGKVWDTLEMCMHQAGSKQTDRQTKMSVETDLVCARCCVGTKSLKKDPKKELPTPGQINKH